MVEEQKEFTEAPIGQDLTQLVVNLEEGAPSDEIASLCMDCHEQGTTRFMYTKIPMFKEIILSSFYCDHCGFKNTEVQFSGKIADSGVKYVLTVDQPSALNRSVVKSEFATIRIPELDFEIPPQTQKGSINTIEGFLANAIEGISALQAERRKFDPITAGKLDEFVGKLTEYKDGKHCPFTFEVTDASGNSFIQNPNAPAIDENLKHTTFDRSVEDYQAMGYNVDQASAQKMADEEKSSSAQKDVKESTKSVAMKKEEQEALLQKMAAYAKKEEISAAGIDFSKPIDLQNEEGDVTKELMTFQTQCHACSADGLCKMCIATIPYFKEIIIMAFSCDYCGHRSSEIKQGGGISEKATKITFNVEKPEDCNRDVFKSDTTFLCIPEIDMELQPGTLGSMYTTMEGLLDKIIDHLDSVNPFAHGDSATNVKYQELLTKMRTMKEGNTKFTVVLDDPLSNCFIYNPHAPEEDPQIKIEVYERTEEQNEELGINDMNV